MWVKICGTTTAADARAAVEAGADAVGFVLVEGSRRRVTAEAAGAMETPAGVQRVGVVATRDVEEMARMVAAGSLTGVQLHGGEAAMGELVVAARRRLGPGVGVVPVVHWVVGAGGVGVAERLREMRGVGVRRVLLDAQVGVELGGTGVSFDWARAAAVLAEAREGMELVLAGGLRPETVAEAIRVLRPWGVDVVSGVEREAGRKDDGRVREFVRAARLAG